MVPQYYAPSPEKKAGKSRSHRHRTQGRQGDNRRYRIGVEYHLSLKSPGQRTRQANKNKGIPIDRAECQLHKLIAQGELGAIKFFLESKGGWKDEKAVEVKRTITDATAIRDALRRKHRGTRDSIIADGIDLSDI